MKLNLNSVLFNVAGLGLVVFLAGYMIQSALTTERIPACSKRYGDGHQFSLTTGDGNPMTPIELQARLPSRAWGLLTNARVVAAADKSPFLQVALGLSDAQKEREAEDPDEKAGRLQDGVGFLWRLQSLEKVRAACLTYRVYLSKDFSFEGRGTLPGLYSVKDDGDVDVSQPQQGFVSRLHWDQAGGMGVSIKSPLTAGNWLPGRGTLWPVNRWFTVEQEAVLNTPNKADGIVRLWIDGQLKIENTTLDLGAVDETGMSGVVADIGAIDQGTVAARITLSPFIVQAQ